MAIMEQKQEKAIAALLATQSYTDAAATSGLSESTLRRLFKDEAFQANYKAARANLLDDVVTALQGNSLAAVKTLREIMMDRNAPASSRVAAAKGILETGFKGRELVEMEQRITTMEEALQAQGET